MICPKCGIENTDNWPINVNEIIVDGGCQSCWEDECDKSWWEMVEKIHSIEQRKGESNG